MELGWDNLAVLDGGKAATLHGSAGYRR